MTVYEHPFFPGRVTERTYQSTNCRNCCKTIDLAVSESRTLPPGRYEGGLIALGGTDPVIHSRKTARRKPSSTRQGRDFVLESVQGKHYRICFLNGHGLSVASVHTCLVVLGQEDLV
jgi:hypothetical protein